MDTSFTPLIVEFNFIYNLDFCTCWVEWRKTEDVQKSAKDLEVELSYGDSQDTDGFMHSEEIHAKADSSRNCLNSSL